MLNFDIDIEYWTHLNQESSYCQKVVITLGKSV